MIKSKTGIAAIVCTLLIALIVGTTLLRNDSAPDTSETPNSPVESPTSERIRPEISPTPTSDEILQMTSGDWERRFTKFDLDLNPEYKSEIVMLAGELQDSIAGGLDPKSEEAGAYVTTISILLVEK